MNKFDEIPSARIRDPLIASRQRDREYIEYIESAPDKTRLLQVNFRYKAGEPFERLACVLARTDVGAPGCLWKTWFKTKDHSEAGVLYLFKDSASLNRFLQGPVVNDLRHQEGVSDVSIKEYDAVKRRLQCATSL